MATKYSKRKDGRFYSRVYLGKDEKGKLLYKNIYGKTAKEVDKKVQEVKFSLHKGLEVSLENDTFGKWAKRWFSIKVLEVSEKQANVYKSMIKHLDSELKDIPITKVKTYQIQDIIIWTIVNKVDRKK